MSDKCALFFAKKKRTAVCILTFSMRGKDVEIRLSGCRHEWPERAGFYLDRPKGLEHYIFIHFKTPVSYVIDGKEHRLSPGACVICPPNTPSVIHSEGQLIHDWMHLTGDLAELLKTYSLECKRIYYVRDSAYISRIVRSLEREYYSSIPYKNELIDIKLREMFIHISREVLDAESAQDVNSDVYEAFKRLRIRAFANIAENPSISDMARDVHLSESRFYALYKQIFGISPKNDLIIARIERAKNLLEQNKYNNSEIAALTGYTNEYHFIRQFKKIEGITPGEYAKAKSKGQM